MADYVIKRLEEAPDVLGDYPGEMRMMTYELDAEKVAFTWRRMPPKTGGKGSYGHRHNEAEEEASPPGDDRAQLDAIVAQDDQSRRLWTIMDLTLATMRGVLRHSLATHPRGFEVIDDYDCREWLLLNGASRQSVDSGYLRAKLSAIPKSDAAFSFPASSVGPRVS